jgi:hypothetical protein
MRAHAVPITSGVHDRTRGRPVAPVNTTGRYTGRSREQLRAAHEMLTAIGMEAFAGRPA